MRRVATFLLSSLALVACTGGGDGDGAADDLRRIARSADRLTYKATYTFTILGRLEEATEATFSVAQRPPDSVHQTSVTPAIEGASNAVTWTTWIVRREGTTYACGNEGKVSCIAGTGPPGAFGHRPVDEAIALARARNGFRSVSEPRGDTIAGERATCYGSRSRTATPPPAVTPQPRYQPSRYEFEYCYARDGVLLRWRQIALGPVPSGISRQQYVFEATEVSRLVADADLELPGPLRTPPPRKQASAP